MTTPERKMVTVIDPAMIQNSLDPDYLATLKAVFDQAAADGPLAPDAEAVQVMSSPVDQDLIIFTYTDTTSTDLDVPHTLSELRIQFYEPPHQKLRHEVLISRNRISVESAWTGGPYRKEYTKYYRTKFAVSRHRRDSNPDSEYQLTFSNWPVLNRYLKEGYVPRSGHLLNRELVIGLKYAGEQATGRGDLVALHQSEILGLLFKKWFPVALLDDRMVEYIAARFQDLSVLWAGRPMDIETVLRALAVIDEALYPGGIPKLRKQLHGLLLAEEAEGCAPWPASAVVVQ